MNSFVKGLILVLAIVGVVAYFVPGEDPMSEYPEIAIGGDAGTGSGTLELFHSASTATFSDTTAPVQGDLIGNYFLDIDRSAEAGDKDFIIIGSITTTVDIGGHSVGAQLMEKIGASATSSLIATDAIQSNKTDHGPSPMFIATTTISNTASKVSVGFFSDSNTDDISVKYGSLIALEIPSGTQQAAENAIASSGSNTTAQDGLSLAFTPGTTQDYLILAYADVAGEDWKDNGAPEFQLLVEGAAVVDFSLAGGNTNSRPFSTNNPNNDLYMGLGVVDVVNLASGGSRTIKWTYKGDGSADEARIKNQKIIAIPLDDVGITYNETTQPVKQGPLINTTFQDAATSTVSLVNNNDNLAFFYTEISQDNISTEVGIRYQVDGTNYTTYNSSRWNDSDNDQIPYTAAFGFTGTGSKTFTIQGNSQDGSNGIYHQNSRIIILDFGSVASRRVYILE